MSNPYNNDHRKVIMAVNFQKEITSKTVDDATPILEVTDAIVNRINQWHSFGIVEIHMFEVIEDDTQN